MPDADDRHVLAAAITAGAATIVTFNRRHFPAARLSPYGIQALSPDAFLCAVYDATPERFREAVQQILARLRNPPRTWEGHVTVLRDNGLTQLAARLAATVVSD